MVDRNEYEQWCRENWCEIGTYCLNLKSDGVPTAAAETLKLYPKLLEFRSRTACKDQIKTWMNKVKNGEPYQKVRGTEPGLPKNVENDLKTLAVAYKCNESDGYLDEKIMRRLLYKVLENDVHQEVKSKVLGLNLKCNRFWSRVFQRTNLVRGCEIHDDCIVPESQCVENVDSDHMTNLEIIRDVITISNGFNLSLLDFTPESINTLTCDDSIETLTPGELDRLDEAVFLHEFDREATKTLSAELDLIYADNSDCGNFNTTQMNCDQFMANSMANRVQAQVSSMLGKPIVPIFGDMQLLAVTEAKVTNLILAQPSSDSTGIFASHNRGADNVFPILSTSVSSDEKDSCSVTEQESNISEFVEPPRQRRRQSTSPLLRRSTRNQGGGNKQAVIDQSFLYALIEEHFVTSSSNVSSSYVNHITEGDVQRQIHVGYLDIDDEYNSIVLQTSVVDMRFGVLRNGRIPSMVIASCHNSRCISFRPTVLDICHCEITIVYEEDDREILMLTNICEDSNYTICYKPPLGEGTQVFYKESIPLQDKGMFVLSGNGVRTEKFLFCRCGHVSFDEHFARKRKLPISDSVSCMKLLDGSGVEFESGKIAAASRMGMRRVKNQLKDWYRQLSLYLAKKKDCFIHKIDPGPRERCLYLAVSYCLEVQGVQMSESQITMELRKYMRDNESAIMHVLNSFRVPVMQSLIVDGFVVYDYNSLDRTTGFQQVKVPVTRDIVTKTGDVFSEVVYEDDKTFNLKDKIDELLEIYGNQTVIQCMAARFNINIVVHTVDSTDTFTPSAHYDELPAHKRFPVTECDSATKTVAIAYNNYNHYDAVISREHCTDCEKNLLDKLIKQKINVGGLITPRENENL